MQPTTFPQVPPYSGNRARWPAGLTHLPQAPASPATPAQPQRGAA